MPFFKTSANLPANEKARIEFHLQQLVECIGPDRFKLPVLDSESLIYTGTSLRTPQQILSLAGEHLGHDVSGISIETVPQETEKCGGGG